MKPLAQQAANLLGQKGDLMHWCRIRLLMTSAFLLLQASCSTPGLPKISMQERFQRVKQSTVRILVNGRPSGTGFAVTPNLIATDFHVVQLLSPTANGQTQISYASKIEVQLPDGRVISATPHPSVQGPGLLIALGKDVALLSVPLNDLTPLKLGSFSAVSEGDPIYLAGFPLFVAQPIVATGILSTKWKMDGYLGQGGPRDVAWLDVTMNAGNSGGPVLSFGGDASQDVVVGIANFSLNPFAKSAEDFAAIAADFPGNAIIMGVDFKRFATLIGSALASQSHGVGGCIAIDYLQLPQ